MPQGHSWDPITDLDPDWPRLCRDDLRAAHEQWRKEKALLRDPAKLSRLQERLATEWAIEAGIIEKLYSVDRGITVALLDAGLSALALHSAGGQLSREAAALIEDQRAALELIMDLVGGSRLLTDGFIRELHHGLTRSQEFCEARDQFGRPLRIPLLHGAWKTLPNNPTRPDGSVHEYCPPEFVQDEMDQLLRLHRLHEEAAVCPEVESAWLHHRFTQIHPFQDGNGRVARALAASVFLRDDCLMLVIRDAAHKNRYLAALEDADGGDLRGLVDLFADIQIEDMRNAAEFIRSLRGEGLINLAASAAERATLRVREEEQRSRAITSALQRHAIARLEEVSAELQRQFTDQHLTLEARVFESASETAGWWTWQIIETAKRFGYWVDLMRPRAWVQLRLRVHQLEDVQTRMVVSFHAQDRAADLNVATAFLSVSARSQDEGVSPVEGLGVEVVCAEPFRYRSGVGDVGSTLPRFATWFDQAVESAIDIWQRRL